MLEWSANSLDFKGQVRINADYSYFVIFHEELAQDFTFTPDWLLWQVTTAYIILKLVCFFHFHSDVTVYHNARFGEGSGPYNITSVGCSGDEGTLLDCTHTLNPVCLAYNEAGVRCDGKHSHFYQFNTGHFFYQFMYLCIM